MTDVPGAVDQDAAHVARTLQEGLAPVSVPTVPGFHVEARYETGGYGEVGGDWYDVLDLPGDGIAVVVGDVAGHGVGAATTMAQLRHAARAYLFEDHSPASVLTRLSHLAQWALPGEIATAVIAVLPDDSAEIRIASAGHLPPLLLTGTTAEYLSPPRGPALGVTAAVHEEAHYPFGPDAALLLYTDGVVERRGESIDSGLARLAQLAVEVADDAGMCDRIVAALPDGPGDDDLALLMVRRNEEA